MLQWMGGSRRKVTASRKSTHKRQKQYFEQRRRQQHHHLEAAAGGNYSEQNRTSGQQNENNRSLDILSLLNLSALAQEHRSISPITKEKSKDDALNYVTLPHLPAVQSKDVRAQEHSGIEETGISSSYQMGTACPKMISTGAPCNNAENLKTDGVKMNQLKMALECQLPVIDILEDDDPISCCKNSLPPEAHVAFSIEGLGTVESQTPVHSPEAHTRTLSDCFHSPSKATNIANASDDLDRRMVNLECELDALMHNTSSPFSRSSLNQPLRSEESVDLFSNKKKKKDFEEFSLFNDCNYGSDLLGDDELFCRSKAHKESIWNDSGIFTGNILEESDFPLPDKNWMDSVYPCADFFNTVDFRKKDSEHFTKQEKRTTIKRGGRFGTIEYPTTTFKYRKLGNASNLIPSDVTWDSSIGKDPGDLNDEFGESCFITNYATESLSLPSEESCSSIAERGRRTQLNFKDKLAKRDHDIFLSESECSEEYIPPRERYSKESNTLLKDNMHARGNFTRLSNPSRLMQIPELHTTAKKRLKPDHSKCYETGYDLGVQSSGGNSFSETSEATKHVSPVCGHWTEDLLHTIGDTKESNRSCLEKLCKSPAECSPGCNFISDTHDLDQPNLLNLSGSSSNIQNIIQVSSLGDKSHKTPDVHLTPEREKFHRQADACSAVQISDSEKFQLLRDNSSGNKSLSSGNGDSTGLSDSQIEHRDSRVPSFENPKICESKKNCFQETDNMPSFETSKISKGKQCNADMKCQFTRASLFCETGSEEVEDIQGKQRLTRPDALSTADSTCQQQVTVFDNRVVQLFCVQVLKEVSAKVNEKHDYKK